MRILRNLFLACALLVPLTSAAQESTQDLLEAKPDVQIQGQFAVTPGRYFGETKLADELTISGYAQGALFTNTSSSPLMFFYLGSSLTYKNTELKLLGSLFTACDGPSASLGVSIWFDQQKLFVDDLSFFIEGDLYFPVHGHEIIQYYSVIMAPYQLMEDLGIGPFAEFFGAVDQAPFESAIGFGLYFKKAMLFFCYDFTPADEKQDAIFIRLHLKP